MTLEDNEFTKGELLAYIKAAYGKSVSGKKIGYSILGAWIRLMRIPPAYGGNKILKYEKLGHVFIFTVEGLSRSLLDDLDAVRRASIVNLPVIEKKRSRAKKQRTELYYTLLGSKQTTKVSLNNSILPNNWKMLGMKPNQTVDAVRKGEKTKKVNKQTAYAKRRAGSLGQEK